MFDEGSGLPLVVVPGLQGRWEWMRPALRCLSRCCRTISYSLCGDIGSRRRLEPGRGFENFVDQLDAVLDAAGLDKAAICGVSFGGFIALHYAAQRQDRVTALVLVSAPGPGFKPTAQQEKWLARPWLSAPVFVMTSPARVWPEIRAAIPDWAGRLDFVVRQAIRCAAAPMLPPLMSSRMRWASTVDFVEDSRRVRAPTLVVTGEPELDRVVPVTSTRSYASLITGAQYVAMSGTGHMGLLTQPARFSNLICEFVHANSH